MTRSRFGKYVAFARIGWTEARAERNELYGRVVFFALILGVFSALWRAVAKSATGLGQNPQSLVWYLATTEWILLSAPQIQFQIENEVRRGDVAYQLSRPVSYVGSLFAQALGMLAARTPVLLAAAAGFALLFSGGLPEQPGRLLYAVAFGLLGSIGLISLHIIIGLFAFFLGDIAPLHWVVQKLGFVLGGLVLPLEFYPRFLVRIAAWTPFPSLLYGPASFLLGAAPERAVRLGAELVFWIVLMSAAAVALFRRAASSLELNGG
jgi:ABC-2 type transport system permease protein